MPFDLRVKVMLSTVFKSVLHNFCMSGPYYLLPFNAAKVFHTQQANTPTHKKIVFLPLTSKILLLGVVM
jgi:hypothetical protein